MTIGAYVTKQLLHLECGFPSYCDPTLEPYFETLDEEYACVLRRPIQFEELAGNIATVEDLKTNYVTLLSTVTTRKVDLDTLFKVFALSRDYIRHFKNQRHNLYAMSICYWIGNYIDSCREEVTDRLYSYSRSWFKRTVNNVYIVFDKKCRIIIQFLASICSSLGSFI